MHFVNVGISKKITAGHPTVLHYDEENEIVATCQVLQGLGYSLTREMVTKVVTDYPRSIGRPNPFRLGIPGPDWWSSFLKRWPSIRERKPEHLSKKRAQGVTQNVVDEWIKTVHAVFEKQGLTKLSNEDLAKRL